MDLHLFCSELSVSAVKNQHFILWRTDCLAEVIVRLLKAVSWYECFTGQLLIWFYYHSKVQFLRKRLISSQLGHAAFIDWNATFVACAFTEYIPEFDKLHSEIPQKLLFPRVWLLVSLMELMGLNNIRHHWLNFKCYQTVCGLDGTCKSPLSTHCYHSHFQVRKVCCIGQGLSISVCSLSVHSIKASPSPQDWAPHVRFVL